MERIAQGEGWVAVAKPSGLPVVPTRQDPEGETVQRLLEAELGQKVWVVHRLDMLTSGVLVLATDLEAHRRLSLAFEKREVEKTYLALCRRQDPDAPTAGRIDLPIAENPLGGMQVVREPDPTVKARASQTRFRVLSLEKDLAAIEARPRTGRRHQIRLHLAAVGWPLAIDPLYGGKEPLEKDGVRCERLTLHAWQLSLPGEETLVCPPPPDLAPFLGGLP
ncbi:MAG: RNA pseudouridine synthase [Deltaproteobacteria bacterium]|nr:RNA pseudouridine synthase [Deltaproteobacteria bacterium]